MRCEPVSRDVYGRTVASCSVGAVDLAEWLVRGGLYPSAKAFNYP
ncbi:hypothetical protein [Bradyrhizobium ottawaense]